MRHPELNASRERNAGICDLFELVDEIAGASTESHLQLLRTIALVNQLACHNSPTVRSWMKHQGLFESRDALIHELLHAVPELPTEQVSQYSTVWRRGLQCAESLISTRCGVAVSPVPLLQVAVGLTPAPGCPGGD